MATSSYPTILATATAGIVEKRSRFLAALFPTKTPEEAAAVLERVKAQHREASHHVYAYRLWSGFLTRYSDDAEPQGTAGFPSLEVLRREGLWDVTLVTVRYFGGTLLGAGGLTRAYAAAAKAAVDAARIAVMTAAVRCRVCLPYAEYRQLEGLVSAAGGQLLNTDFAEAVTATLMLPEETEASFCAALADATKGKAQLAVEDRLFFPLEKRDF